MPTALKRHGSYCNCDPCRGNPAAVEKAGPWFCFSVITFHFLCLWSPFTVYIDSTAWYCSGDRLEKYIKYIHQRGQFFKQMHKEASDCLKWFIPVAIHQGWCTILLVKLEIVAKDAGPVVFMNTSRKFNKWAGSCW